MPRILLYGGVVLIVAIIISGCARPLQNISCIKSEGVDRIPAKIALYPILSTPLGEERYHLRDGSYSFGLDGGTSAEMYGENVVISPPAESQLTVTKESKMLTAMLSARLSDHGFSLSQLPVEIFPDSRYGYDTESEGAFFVTVDLLDRLSKKNNLKAILIGDVFFRNERNHGIIEKRITFAHLKVIDVTNLDILGQVLFPYDSEGVELNQATERITAELADLAGLADQEKAEK